MRSVLAALLLMAWPAAAVPLQQDCRGSGPSIGTALMSADGTITLTFNGPIMRGVLAYHRGDPRYPRILSHVGAFSRARKSRCHPSAERQLAFHGIRALPTEEDWP
jgi:hypothetical protein